MSKRKLLFNKVYIISALMMLFMTGLAGIQAMASTSSEERKVHWESSTKDEEIQAPDGLTSDGGKWESPTFTSSDNEVNDKDIATKPMTAANEYAAIAAALAGVLAISASKKSTNEGLPTVSEGNGIWVPETDRDEVIKMINKAASKEYYIDANGFVKEVPGTVENLSKSSTYSSVLDRLIAGDNKVVIGVGDGWVSDGETGLEANAFTGNNSGITIGDNGTPQVVIVSGKDMSESTADMTLAHELTHALRGEEGIKSINMTGGINKDEEAHTIELENKIRTELGYAVRKDGDTSDGGDGSYGKYNDSSEDDWYNKIDQMQKSVTLSGNPYSYSLFGAIVSAVVSIVRAITSSSSSSSSSSSHSSSRSSSSSSSSSSSRSSSSSSNSSSTPVPPPIPIWGSRYDDSVWGNVVGAVSNVVNSVVGWVSESKPKQNWDTFWNSIPNTVTDNINVLSKIGAAISTYLPGIFSIPATLGQVFNSIVLKPTGWVKDNNGDWYYYNSNYQKESGWIQDNGRWYYLDEHNGKMQTGWVQDTDGKWYYLNHEGKDGKPKGAMQTGWVKDTDDKWYYLNPERTEGKPKGAMQTGWIEYGNQMYFLDYSTGEMRTGEIQGGDGYFYLNDDGTMFTGWRRIPGTDDEWYYYDDTGVRRTGWAPYYDEEEDKIEWYYLGEDNKLKTGWLEDESKWYYLYCDTGYMATGKSELDGKMYYFDDSGAMKTGWIKDNSGNWYYADSNGVLQTGTVTIDDKEYKFDSNGQWLPDDNFARTVDCDSQIVYQTERKPGEEKDGSPAGDSTYGDYSKERILNINQNGVSFSTDNFLNGGIENLDEDQLFLNLKELSTIFSAGDLQDVAEDMINHFRYGNGAEYSNNVLTERVRAHASTQAYADKMLKGLKEGLAINKGDLSAINTEYWRDKLTQGIRPSYSTWGDKAEGLTFCINDTWGNTIEVKDYHFDGENYSGTMKIKIYDEFGLNESDIDNSHPFHNLVGFRSWFLLQHYDKFGGKYKPFTTVIDLEYPFEGNINVLDPIEAQVTDGAAVKVTY